MEGGFGLDAFVASPPWSLLVSLLLMLGMFRIGWEITRAALPESARYARWRPWASPAIGAAVTACVTTPLVQFLPAGPAILWCLALLIVLAGFSMLPRSIAALASPLRRAGCRPGAGYVFALIILPLALLATGPATNGDSLDYHLGTPLVYLANGHWLATPEWFASRLAGSGEALIALGLTLGAEQFGSLLQFSGLLAVAGVLLFISEQNSGHVLRRNFVLAAGFATTPVLLMLVSAHKPQLLPVGLTTLALALIVYCMRKEMSPQARLRCFALICLALMAASEMKFNYTLSGGIVGLIALLEMWRHRLLGRAVLVLAVAAIAIKLPTLCFKMIYWDASFMEALLAPFPDHLPGYAAYEHRLRTFELSDVPFPISLLVPDGLGGLTTVLGAAPLALVLLRPGRDRASWLVISAALALFVAGSILGQKTARFYLEVLAWLLMALAIQPVAPTGRLYTFAKTAIVAQSVAVLLVASVFAAMMLPSAFSSTAREAVMQRFAFGYDVMHWADQHLPADAVVLNEHRSTALVPRASVATDWAHYVYARAAQAEVYLNEIKQAQVSYVLLKGEIRNYPLKNCLGMVLAGPERFRRATRSPFKPSRSYQAQLVEFHSQDLPGCARGRK